MYLQVDIGYGFHIIQIAINILRFGFDPSFYQLSDLLRLHGVKIINYPNLFDCLKKDYHTLAG